MAKKKTSLRNRWAVLQIYNEYDGAQPLVHVIDVFDCKETAVQCARESAQEILDEYNGFGPHKTDYKFDDVWEKVDNGEGDEWQDLGWDPIEDSVCWRLRVRWFTEEAK